MKANPCSQCQRLMMVENGAVANQLSVPFGVLERGSESLRKA